MGPSTTSPALPLRGTASATVAFLCAASKRVDQYQYCFFGLILPFCFRWRCRCISPHRGLMA
jgi:hypothetical protein